jgi:hypothetical protein
MGSHTSQASRREAAPLPPHISSVEHLFALHNVTHTPASSLPIRSNELDSAAQAMPHSKGRGAGARAAQISNPDSRPFQPRQPKKSKRKPKRQPNPNDRSQESFHRQQPPALAPTPQPCSPSAPPCVICMEQIVYAAIGLCGHTQTCAFCCLKSRLNYDNKKCAVCTAHQAMVAIGPWRPDMQPPAALPNGGPKKSLLKTHRLAPEWAPGVLVLKTEQCASLANTT